MTNLLLVRHSEPALKKGVLPSKWKITERGQDRSRLLGEYLNIHGIDRIIASSEVKAIETAEIAAEVAGIRHVHQEHDLREHNGDGAPFISSAERRSLVLESLRKPDEMIYGTETVRVAMNRFSRAIRRLINENTDQSVAVVAHGTVISAFIAAELDIDPGAIWSSQGLPGFVEIEWPNPSRILNQQKFE